MGKIGRNDPCPCGSGIKYKKCCLGKQTSETRQIPAEILENLRREVHQQQEHEASYGKIRPPITTEFQGHKFVAVGNTLHYSSKWKTFPDFLVDYARSVLGSEWGNNELVKPFPERHQILKWYDGLRRFQQKHADQRDENGVIGAVPTGSAAAFLHLAYDLYVVKDNARLQDLLLKRLKNKDQFQGARYELFATATCIRAGYKIYFEDESDVRRSHPEFLAVHKELGQRIAVEAKSRHRPGVLDFPGTDGEPGGEIRVNIRNALSKALMKEVHDPFVIFIDLNLPPADDQRALIQAIKGDVESVCGTDVPEDKFNMILLTNHPHHWVSVDEEDPPSYTYMIYSQKPAIQARFPKAILDLYEAARQYKNIPNFFPE